MLLVVCLNVDFAVRACQDEDGIVVQSIKKLFGSVSNLRNMENGFARIVKEFQNRLLRMLLLNPIECYVQIIRDVLEEFIKRVEKTLSEDSIEDKIEKLNKNAYNIQYKRKKLLESYLEGVVAKDIYEETDMGYEKKLSEVNAQLGMLEQQYDNESSLQRRLVDFRKALSKNQILEGFDRGIFESIIEKVIVGGYDENGEKDPYKIIFIYKTGFKNEIGNAKERFGKKSKAVEKAKEMCSHIVDEVKDVCSYVSDNTCGDGMPLSSEKSGNTYQH